MDDAVLHRNRRPFDYFVGAIDDEVGVVIGLGLGFGGRDDGQTWRLPGNLHVGSGDPFAVLRRGDSDRVRRLGDGKADRRPVHSGDRNMSRVGDDQLDGVFAGTESVTVAGLAAVCRTPH